MRLFLGLLFAMMLTACAGPQVRGTGDLGLVIGRRRLAACAAWRLLLLLFHLTGELAKNLQRVLPGEPADADDQQNGPEAQAFAATEAHPAATARSMVPSRR